MGIGLIVVWGLLSASTMPIRQAFLNGLIPSQQRATILSFDSLMSSAGGVVAQPILGRAADVWSYPASYVISGVLSAFAVPFVVLALRGRAHGLAHRRHAGRGRPVLTRPGRTRRSTRRKVRVG